MCQTGFNRTQNSQPRMHTEFRTYHDARRHCFPKSQILLNVNFAQNLGFSYQSAIKFAAASPSSPRHKICPPSLSLKEAIRSAALIWLLIKPFKSAFSPLHNSENRLAVHKALLQRLPTPRLLCRPARLSAPAAASAYAFPHNSAPIPSTDASANLRSQSAGIP